MDLHVLRTQKQFVEEAQIWSLVCVGHLNCTKYNEINIHFCRPQKFVTNKIWNEYHIKHVYRDAKKNGNTLVIMAENC